MRKFALAGFAVILLMGMSATARAQAPTQNPSVQFGIQFDGSAFRVSGWKAAAAPPAAGWASIFAIYAAAGDVPPLVGTYSVEGGALVFRPTYPVTAGVHYRAVFTPPGGGARVEKEFDGPPRATAPMARVVHVYPSSDVVPSNQLRLYIYFSAPMSRGEAAQRIHVLDANGKVLAGSQGVFLPGEELWDPDYRRLTMTFDPGRIKRGLTSNQNHRPAHCSRKLYTPRTDLNWPDARGVPMVTGFVKVFRRRPGFADARSPKVEDQGTQRRQAGLTGRRFPRSR